mgnify:FL=1
MKINGRSWHYCIYASTFLILIEALPEKVRNCGFGYWTRILVLAPIIWGAVVPYCGIFLLVILTAMWVIEYWHRLTKITWLG